MENSAQIIGRLKLEILFNFICVIIGKEFGEFL